MIATGRTLIVFGSMLAWLAVLAACNTYSKRATDNPAPLAQANPLEIAMVLVKGGSFTMGCVPEREGDDCADGEKPAHRVTVSDFNIGKYEVTQAQWRAVMGNNPSLFPGDNRPVEWVSWKGAQEFIRRVNVMTGQNCRLPTEAEWEYAARGGANSRGYRYSGGNDADTVAWYYENSGMWKLNDNAWPSGFEDNNNQTHPVGTKAANELGIYDMSGNVWEWVADRYGPYGDRPVSDPTGPDQGIYRVLRGGSFGITAGYVRPASRLRINPDRNWVRIIGFRLACGAKY